MIPKCPVCGKLNHSIIYQSSKFNLFICDECKLVMKSFRNRQEAQALQDSVYISLNRLRIKMIKKMAIDRLELLTHFKKRGNLIEIGCATGEFLEIANDCGFNVFGIDASKRYAYYANKKGLNVKNGRLEDIPFDKQTFDVVTMFHLLEHIEDPNKFLQTLTNIMSEDGLLMIVVPNLDSLTNKIFGFQHPVFHQLDHLFFYDKSTLSGILTNNEFKVLSIQSKEYPHHPFTSLQGYLINLLLKRSSKSSNPVSNKTCGYNTDISNNSNNGRTKEFMKLIALNAPYFLSYLIYPLLRSYGIIIENLIRGHELIVFAQKK